MSNEAKVGTFVVVALMIFVAAFLSVATVQLGGEKIVYKTFFKFAGGLDTGDLVRFGGLKAGVIDRVQPSVDDPTLAEVTVSLRSDVPVNADSTATISSLNALGDNYLEITPGSKDARRLQAGETIPSKEAVTLSDITVKISEITDTAQSVITNLEGNLELLIGDLRVLTGNLQDLTGDENQRNVQSLLKNANEMVSDQAPKIDQITDQISQVLERVDAVVVSVERVTNTANDTVANVNRTVDETRDPIKRDLEQLEATLIEAREVLEEVRAIAVVNGADINATIENFRSTSENLEQFSDEIRQRPWSLLRTKPKPDRQVPVAAPAK